MNFPSDRGDRVLLVVAVVLLKSSHVLINRNSAFQGSLPTRVFRFQPLLYRAGVVFRDDFHHCRCGRFGGQVCWGILWFEQLPRYILVMAAVFLRDEILLSYKLAKDDDDGVS